MRATSERTLCACRCMRFNLRMVDPRHVAVIPATALTHPCASRNSHFLCSKAGIQSAVLILCAPIGTWSMYEMYLWVVDPRQVAFLCSCKEKLPKESTPPSLRRSRIARERFPALLGQAAREPNSPAAKDSPLGLEHRLAKPRVLSCGARLALGGFDINHPRSLRSRWVFWWIPVWRVLSIARRWGEPARGADRKSAPDLGYIDVP